MHSKLGSILKRWHSFSANPRKLQKKWAGVFYKNESDYLRSISCADCRSFDSSKNACGIGFGTPLRKCVVSSIEAHFNNCVDEHVLEIGFGRFMLAKSLITRSGGVWTGIEPKIPKSVVPTLGQGGHGDAANIPFGDATFDRVLAFNRLSTGAKRWGAECPQTTVSV